MFETLGSLIFVDLSDCASGFFLPLKKNPRGPMIVSVQDDVRQIVYLDPEFNFIYNRLSPDLRPGSRGILIPHYDVEVELSSLFDGNYGAQIGDLLVNENGVTVIARAPDGWNDAVGIPLQTTFPSTVGPGFGFKTWKLTVGSGEDKKTLWERIPSGLETDS